MGWGVHPDKKKTVERGEGVDLLNYCHENGVRTETILCHALSGFGRTAAFS